MYEENLLSIGLTQNEVRVYLTLLKVGKTQSGKLTQEAGVSSGKIYETLTKLIDKGLVGVSTQNGVKQFHAANPDSLLLYMREREKKVLEQTQQLESIIPDLKKIKQFAGPEEGVYLIKGFRGIKPIVYELISQGKGEFKVFGVRSSKNKTYNTFWTHWHQERVKNHKKARLLFADRETSYWKFFKMIKFTQIRSVSSLSPSAIMVIDEHTFIFSYDEEFTCIHIISLPIARSFESFFESLWNIGKP